MTPEPEEPMVVGDMSAAYLQVSVRTDDDGVFLQISDGEIAVNIDAAYGTLPQQILGLQRLLSGVQEQLAELRRTIRKAS